MAFQAVPDTAEIDVIYTLNAVLVQNVFYAEFLGGYTLADLQALADVVDLRVGASWLSLQPPEAIYLRTEVRGLALPNDLLASQGLSGGPGTAIGASMPNNVTVSIKKTSGFTGRSARGRTYWIGIAGVELNPANENLLDSTFVANCVAAVGGIRADITTLPVWTPVLVSRFTAGVPRAFGKTFPWVGEVNVDLRVDTQRGRLPV